MGNEGNNACKMQVSVHRVSRRFDENVSKRRRDRNEALFTPVFWVEDVDEALHPGRRFRSNRNFVEEACGRPCTIGAWPTEPARSSFSPEGAATASRRGARARNLRSLMVGCPSNRSGQAGQGALSKPWRTRDREGRVFQCALVRSSPCRPSWSLVLPHRRDRPDRRAPPASSVLRSRRATASRESPTTACA